MLSLRAALRLPGSPCVAFVGAGGKTTAMYTLARQLDPPVIVSATTHMGSWQLELADTIYVVKQREPFALRAHLESDMGVLLVIGPLGEDDRHTGLNDALMLRLYSLAEGMQIPLLIEADGSRMRPLKAPAQNEPVIPDFVDLVVVVAGLSAVGKPFSEEIVHRPEIFSALSGIHKGEEITPRAIIKVLCHSSGGLKNIPRTARRILLLNQADSENLRDRAQEIARVALSHYDGVIISSLKSRGLPVDSKDPHHTRLIRESKIYSVYERTAGIILAAGASRRFGEPKQLLDWNGEPLVRRLAATALASGLSAVFVITGANAEMVTAVLEDLPVTCIPNPLWQEGQSSSIRSGIQALGDQYGAAIFILADQPFTSADLIRALATEHSISMAPIIAPAVNGQRGNPVLFDKTIFPELLMLRGNQGGRVIFDHITPHLISWHDPKILIDIDTPEDYRRVKVLGNDRF